MTASCIHFRGIQNPICAAGIALRAVRRLDDPLPIRLPCLASSPELAAATADRCAQRRFPTLEEEAAQREANERAAITAMNGDCPRCGAKMVRVERSSGGYTAHCPTCTDSWIRVRKGGS